MNRLSSEGVTPFESLPVVVRPASGLRPGLGKSLSHGSKKKPFY